MTQRKLLHSRKKEDFAKEIVEDSRRWVKNNKGLSLTHANTRKYESPRVSSEFMDCSMPMTFDHYSHCSLGCLYCFSYMFKSSNQATRDFLSSIDVKKVISMFEGKPLVARHRKFYEHFVSKKFLLHWGGMADPFCFFEERNNIGYPLLQTLGEINYPTLFSFKGGTIFNKRYKRLFQKYSNQKNFAFQVSIVTYDEKLAADAEMGVMPPKKRIEAIKMLSDMGYYTILRLRPYIIGVTDEGLDDLLHECLEAGIGGVSMEFFAVDSRGVKSVKMRNRWLGNLMGIKDFYRYFKELSPSERGGYYRLNRLVKEDHVKKVYKFCADNNLVFACSDPDYKELNTSGSCCGMPDDYPDNELLENWTTSQLTYHLKEARRKYHLTGKDQFLYFDKVFSGETYMDDDYMGQDHVVCSDLCSSERKYLTHRILARTLWNNLRSPSNPRNYFHGMIMPLSTLDENENYIYKYVPQEYENRWADEGIDLTR